MNHSLEALYKAIGIKRQSFHGYLDRYSVKMDLEEQIVYLVQKVRQDHPDMGIRQMYYKIRPAGMGRDAFENVCRMHGLMIEKFKNFRRTTDSSNTRFFPNRIEGIIPEFINQIWQSDITYFEIKNRFYFITLIQDAFSKTIVGYAASKNLSTKDTTLPSLYMALKNRRGHNLKGLIFHSDGGGQYYQREFLKLTSEKEMMNSMGKSCYENAMAESLNGVIKNKYLMYRNIQTFEDLKRELDRTVLLYNTDTHSALKRMTPESFEKKWLSSQGQIKAKVTESFDANLK